MTKQHPISPPPDLVRKWATWRNTVDEESFWRRIATEAAQWGADQELGACCEWLGGSGYAGTGFTLRAARRPRPSLKQQALDAHKRSMFTMPGDGDTILRALELLPDDTTP